MTQAASGSPAPRAASASLSWTTPQRLRAFVALILVASLALFLVGEAALSRARFALHTVGRDAAPSILAAQEISASLAELDTNAANYLLGTSAHQQQAFQIYEEQRVRLTRRLVDAAENITYGDAEKGPILALFENTGRYMEIVAQARALRDHDDKKGALDMLRVATTTMHRDLLPMADQLDRANRSFMDETYEQQARASERSETLAVITGVALMLALFAAQVFLTRRMRRIVNPCLAAATLLALVFTVLLVRRFGSARDDLKVAKEDAFESIHILWRARALAYDARGDQSRALLDPENARAHRDAFQAHVAQLTSRPDAGSVVRGDIKGLFGEELDNVTFPGERDAALTMIRAFSTYYGYEAKVRALEASGLHARAVDLCVGADVNGATVAFQELDQALERVLAINQSAFERVIEEGDGALRMAEYLDPIFALAIAALAYLGLRPRIKEYAA